MRKWMAERGGYGGGQAEVDEMVGGGLSMP